jgi:Spy/CpxP family protein refolding chaperone
MKELRRADIQLRTLALADNYDEARARQIATKAAQARTEIDMLHAGLQHAVFALLTPEQRKRLDECRPAAAGAPPPPSCVSPRPPR